MSALRPEGQIQITTCFGKCGFTGTQSGSFIYLLSLVLHGNGRVE